MSKTSKRYVLLDSSPKQYDTVNTYFRVRLDNKVDLESKASLVTLGFQDTQGERDRGDSEGIMERKVPGV